MNALLRIFLSVVLLFALSACGADRVAESENLLQGATPLQARGVSRPENINDGRVPPVGSSWNSNRTTVFSSRHAQLVFDLKREVVVGSVALLADNNDVYQVEGSLDNSSYEPLFVAQPKGQSGLQWRFIGKLKQRVRYLRVQPLRGDASLSIAELAVYEDPAMALPPRMQAAKASDTGLAYRSALVNLSGFVLLACALLTRRGSWIFRGLLLLLCVYGLSVLSFTFTEGFPFERLEVSLTRGLVATMALGVVIREAWLNEEKWPKVGLFHVILLLALGFASVFAFYNLGKPQFYDQKNQEPSVVHNYDMRVYFPAAKYYDELKYDGLYLASVASYAEEHRGLNTRELQRTELRDLRNHRMTTVPQVQAEIEGISARFSPERWAEFKRDMSYFWETMGPGGYLGSLRDHGGNATPVWLAITHLMYRSATASNTTLLWGALLDPLLLLLFFVCAWRSFGVRTAALALVVFGANDFYMFGSNWAGATLRNDWMVYWGLGCCALAKHRFKLGGALLALSALIRAFPAFALIVLGIPVALWLAEQYKERGSWPTFKEIREKQAWFFETALGALLCALVMVLFSSLVLGFESWPLWVKKISSFRASPHVNHLSLLTVVAGSEGNQSLVLAERRPFYLLAQVLFVVLTIWAARNKRPHQVAALGMVLMPVFLYPANYYLHAVFLLVLLVDEPHRIKEKVQRIQSGRVWAIVLLICMAQYLTVREENLDVHFYNASVILMSGLLGVLYVLIERNEKGELVWPQFLSLAAPSAPNTEKTPESDAMAEYSQGDE